MIHNYLKLSLRLLRRNPFFTLLNVIGLSIGFTVFLIRWQYSQSELNSDRFHNDWQQIVRFYWSNKNVNDSGYVKEIKSSGNHPAFYNTLASVYPEFADQTKICIQQQFRRTFIGDHDNQIFFSYVMNDGTRNPSWKKNSFMRIPNLFEFFSLPLLKGNPERVFLEPNSIVLNEDLAKKYFRENDIDNHDDDRYLGTLESSEEQSGRGAEV